MTVMITADKVPTATLLGMNCLQRIKYTVIIILHKMNLLEITISFILSSTIQQITSDTIYPISVAIEAPSIPIFGIIVKFKMMLTTAPPPRINRFGQVFLTIRN